MDTFGGPNGWEVKQAGVAYYRQVEHALKHLGDVGELNVLDEGTGERGGGRSVMQMALLPQLRARQARLLLHDHPGVTISPPTKPNVVIATDDDMKMLETDPRPLLVNAAYLSCGLTEPETDLYARLRTGFRGAALLVIAEYTMAGSRDADVLDILAGEAELKEREEWNDDALFIRRHARHTVAGLLGSVEIAGWKPLWSPVAIGRGRTFIAAANPDNDLGRFLLHSF